MGNHETTWSESGCTAYSRIFGPEYYAFDYGGVRFLLFNTGPLLKMAYGHVSPFVTEWARQDLEAHRDQPAIIVTHYPLMDGDVDNWYDVTDALRKPGNVRLFIGGHYHAVHIESGCSSVNTPSCVSKRSICQYRKRSECYCQNSSCNDLY